MFNISKYTIFCWGIIEDGERNSKKLLNVFVEWLYKIVLWGLAVRLSYIYRMYDA